MNDIGFSLMGFLILMIIFYTWGLISVYKNHRQFNRIWLFCAPFLIIAPMLIFVISPFCIKTKNTKGQFDAIIFLIYYIISQFIFTLFFKFGMQSPFYVELSLFSSALSTLLYLICTSLINQNEKVLVLKDNNAD